MDRPAPGLGLKSITPPRQEIMRIRRTFRPVDRAFIQGIIGDLVRLVEVPVDWIFLRTAIEVWNPQHAVFNFQGTKLTPTVKEYTTLIQRPRHPCTQSVPKEMAPDTIEETINSIFSNTISFLDDELLSEGWAHSRALHIVCKCNNYVIGWVMIDNGSALNVCPVTTLNVTFQVLDIHNAFSLLLGRLWIHSAGTIPSSLHQRMKFFVEDKLITVKGEEDYAIYKKMIVPYISIGDDENLPFHSVETISVIRDYGKVGPSRADRMIRKGISRPIEVEEYKNRRGLGFRPSCHEIIEVRKGNHLHQFAAHYERLNRDIPVPPLSHFFPGPPHVVETPLTALPWIPTTGLTLCQPCTPSPKRFPQGFTSALRRRMSSLTTEPQSRLQSNPNLRRADSNPSEECPVEPGPIYFGEGVDEDSRVPEIEESLPRLEDRQLTSVEPTEEINVGTKEEPRILKIGTGHDPTQRARMIDFLIGYQEVFTWSYADMPGLDPSIVKHFLPLDMEKFPPKGQQLQRQRVGLLLRIKEEVVK
ncbi:hypothetical protein CRG98_002332 [Punica granatum]|uniref:G-patch domain-containing protein n=1 Tax=Punica granatum TaxID=22663 RepID=A0A2I0L9C0_PUNGR|nr:hypothetical protein CRG98_002332 [Punica granatum]